MYMITKVKKYMTKEKFSLWDGPVSWR